MTERYIREAVVTLSPEFHGSKVSKAHFVGRINAAIDAANKLDQVKKSLFYGKDNNLEPAAGARNVEGINERVGSGGVNGTNILHAILGIATEAGELLEALRDDYNRETADTMDAVNLREEVGDLFWYLAILANEVGFSFEDAQRVNIAKLRKRYPDKFDAFHANERDLAAERAILEHNGGYAIAESDPTILSTGDVATTEHSDIFTDPTGGDYAPIETNTFNMDAGPMQPLIEEAPTVSGKQNVEAAAASAAKAFDNIRNVAPLAEQSTSDRGGQLALSPAARLHPLHDEHIARQHINREDKKEK